MMNDSGPTVLTLDELEASMVLQIAEEVTRRYESAESEVLWSDLHLWASQIPSRVRQRLHEFAIEEPSGTFVLRGHTIDHHRIGPTPEDWRERPLRHPEFREEVVMLMYAALLGEPFGWRTQQDGNLVHDVFPIRRHEAEQLGMGSRELLTWHTEDAFHPFRGDFLLLASLRNPDAVPTTLGTFDVADLPAEYLDVLFEPRFHIAPDESHLPKNNTSGAVFDTILELANDQAPVPVLFGSKADPYLRIDPYFMNVDDDDPKAWVAFEALEKLVDEGLRDVVLLEGDVLVLNNHRVVHGRRPFAARYDGTDRWLKRVNVTRDLAKSRSMRDAASSRLIG